MDGDDIAVSAYHELCGYALTRGDATFIHQHVVDAFAAQSATPATKPIAIAFALVGLYLHLEKGFNGREVQRAHMKMAREKHAWPLIALPAERGSMTAADVIRAPAGAARDAAIDDWCQSVWTCYCAKSRDTIAALLERHRILKDRPGLSG
ncbi:MAG: DUF5946 family protein [Acidobacteriota bacterium]|nr:DUF5946 family protein [Acidobacteriota bacterium]